jgi:hypothetical protein
VNQYGGKTFAVYKPGSKAEFKQVAKLQELDRVQGIGEANYNEGSLTCMWILNAIEDIATRIIEDREILLREKVGRSPGHILHKETTKTATVDAIAKAAIEDATGAIEVKDSLAIPPKKTPTSERLRPGQTSEEM